MLRAIVVDAAQIQSGQTQLKKNERVGAIVSSPDHPEDIAQEEEPEALIALPLPLGSDHPCRYHRYYHRGPLNEIEPIHKPVEQLASVVASKFRSRPAEGDFHRTVVLSFRGLPGLRSAIRPFTPMGGPV